MIDSRWVVYPSLCEKPISCVLVLPGRAQYAVDLTKAWLKTGFDDTLFIGVTPNHLQWYPMPINALDQDAAVSGLPKAFKAISKVLEKINTKYEVPYNKIAIVGFSAGGVMANYMISHFPHELAGSVSHGGAILEPFNLPEAKFKHVPVILTHNFDDSIFDWEERYLPMKNALLKKKYNLTTIEDDFGGHNICLQDILDAAKVLGPRLGYNQEFFEKSYIYSPPAEVGMEDYE